MGLNVARVFLSPFQHERNVREQIGAHYPLVIGGGAVDTGRNIDRPTASSRVGSISPAAWKYRTTLDARAV